jgi:aldehyde dehydrogenase (NAD+)
MGNARSIDTVNQHSTHAGTLTPELHAHIQQIFSAQATMALTLRKSSTEERINKLKRLRAVIMDHQQAIIDAAQKDFGRSPAEVEFTELMPVIMEISDHCKHLKKWLKPRRAKMSALMFGSSSYTQYEARGRCLIIAPWNYPVTLCLGPLVPAIACGNTVIIKTSEMAPNFSKVLVSIVTSCFDEKEVAIVEGDVSVATALLDLPFDHMFFTGAPNIGKVVMAAAAKHLSSVTLELGGKSPIVIDETADLELAARTIAWGKYINNGQTCIAPDHIYVHKSVMQDFTHAITTAMNEWYGEGMAAKTSQLARIINRRHSERINGLLQNATELGANIVYGGAVDLDTNFISPTLLSDIPDNARIMQEEIFGPLLPLIAYSSIDEVIAKINSQAKPLALYNLESQQEQSRQNHC